MTLVVMAFAAAFSRRESSRGRDAAKLRARRKPKHPPALEILSSRSAFSTISRALSLPRCRCRSSREALKAQSVAARSYLQRALASPKHEGADICADSACCQAYQAREQLKSSWGGDKYAQYSER